MSNDTDPAERLEQFIEDYASLKPADIAKKYDIPRTVIGNGAALLKALGFDITTGVRKSAVAFDGGVVKHLFVNGATVKQIADHLTKTTGATVKTITISAFLKREGLIKAPVSVEDILKADAAAAPAPATQAAA
jgi:hypothetical protein